MFSIQFYPFDDDDEDGQARGVIVLDDFDEGFESCLCEWTRADYEQQWREAIAQVLDGKASGLITAYHDPPTTNFMRWWTMYPMDANVRFHDQLLFLAELGGPFDLSHLDRYALPYRSETDEGEPISEWAVPREDLAAFLGDLRR